MIAADRLYSAFTDNGVNFFTGVPDSLLSDICAYITENTPAGHHIIAANEGAAVGIACGHYMATGEVPVVYMQNSGLGNAVNPLLSLADRKVYSIPLVLLIGYRGEPGIKDEPQHIKQGEVTLPLLEAMDIPYIVLDNDPDTGLPAVEDIISQSRISSRPHAIVVRKGTLQKYALSGRSQNPYPLSREEAMKLVVDSLSERDVVVSTTGKLSRELFEYREEKAHGHGRDFLTVGSMGHSSSIALGIALRRRDRAVYCLDGDGALIMHMGSITNVGNCEVPNFRHIVFNNGAYESVGGQPTLGFSLDIPAIARSCGYKYAQIASTREEAIRRLGELSAAEGPALLELRVNIASRCDLGRPTTTPADNKKHFMEFLNS